MTWLFFFCCLLEYVTKIILNYFLSCFPFDWKPLLHTTELSFQIQNQNSSKVQRGFWAMFLFITSLAGMVQDENFGFRSELYYYLIFNEHSHSVLAEARDVNLAFWNVSMSRLWCYPQVSLVGWKKHLSISKECVTFWFESISYDFIPQRQNSHTLSGKN